MVWCLYPSCSSLPPRPPTRSTLFPYTTLFRSVVRVDAVDHDHAAEVALRRPFEHAVRGELRSEEHTSELQSHSDLVCRLLLEKKKGHVLANGIGDPKSHADPTVKFATAYLGSD